MIVDSHLHGFIWSNKSSAPSALLLSLQILAGNLCCSSRGKILKQMNIKEVVRGEGLAVSTLDYPMLKKKRLFYLWMDGTYSSLHSCLFYTVLQPAWACMFSEWKMSRPVILAAFLLGEKKKRRKKESWQQCPFLAELWFSEQWFSTLWLHCMLNTCISKWMKIFLVVETGWYLIQQILTGTAY